MDPVERMMYIHLVTYLPEDILTKLDRASMATSLEARVPVLDHRLVELAFRLPLAFKIYRGKGKRILRMILHGTFLRVYLSVLRWGLVCRWGSGFAGLFGRGLKSFLMLRRLRQQGILNLIPVRQAWMEHLKGKQNRATQLWGILMFQAWQQEWM